MPDGVSGQTNSSEAGSAAPAPDAKGAVEAAEPASEELVFPETPSGMVPLCHVMSHPSVQPARRGRRNSPDQIIGPPGSVAGAVAGARTRRAPVVCL